MPKHVKEIFHCPKCPNYTFHCGPDEFKTHLKKHEIAIKAGESLQRFRSKQTVTRMQEGIKGGKKP